MYRQREAEVAKLRTKIELAMNSHEEAMAMAKIQFTQELDRLQKELSSIKEPSATQQAYVVYLLESNVVSIYWFVDKQGASLSSWQLYLNTVALVLPEMQIL